MSRQQPAKPRGRTLERGLADEEVEGLVDELSSAEVAL
jgi:hypothetical protein